MSAAKADKQTEVAAPSARQNRLKSALKENLKRRKAQARTREAENSQGEKDPQST